MFSQKNRTLIQYSLVSFIITAAVAAGAGLVIDRQFSDYLVREHIKVHPVVVGEYLERNGHIVGAIQNGDARSLRSSLQALLRGGDLFDSVFRVKVWRGDGTVVWSDDAGIIGKNFRDNSHFQEAMKGNVSYSLKRTGKREHVADETRGLLLEIYVPVRRDNAIVGVIELYERSADLYLGISQKTMFVWGSVSAFGGILYLALFALFSRTNRSLNRAIRELEQTQEVTILALAYQAELRDNETGRHIERTSKYVELLARQMQKDGRYPGYLTEKYIRDLVMAAPLHDIGKVGVPDAILRKPGRLDPGEFAEIRNHTGYATLVLKKAGEKLHRQSYLEIAIQLAQFHHERWDGTGYPAGLSGKQIPLSGRIMALADVYDALRNERVYKKPLPHDECLRIIKAESGRQFDPDIVQAFLAVEKKFAEVSESLAD